MRAGNISHLISPVHSLSGSGDASFFIDAERCGSELDLREDPGMVSPSFCKFDSGLWGSERFLPRVSLDVESRVLDEGKVTRQ